MARSQANLRLNVFEGLRGLTREGKLLYIAVLVEPTINQAGIGALRERRWAKDLELTLAEIEKAMQELDERRFVLFDADTEEILIRTLIRNDGVADKPNLLWAACRAAVLVSSPRLRVVLAEELRKLPPKPAATVGKNGRAYEHPDPHATADQIDPTGGPDDPRREPTSNGSRTIVEPFESEPFENHSRTTGGGGGGGGVSSPPPVEKNSSSKTHTAASRSCAETDPEGFAEFWVAYPRKEAKRGAAKAYAAAVKRGVDTDRILAAARRYAAITTTSEQRFIAHPATWLNQGRYDDEQPAAGSAVAVGYQAPRATGTSSQRVNAILALRTGEPR